MTDETLKPGEYISVEDLRQQLIKVAGDTWAIFIAAPTRYDYLNAEAIERALAAIGYLSLEEIRAQRPEIDPNVIDKIFFSF